MALSKKTILANGLDIELYRIVTNHDFRAGIITAE